MNTDVKVTAKIIYLEDLGIKLHDPMYARRGNTKEQGTKDNNKSDHSETKLWGL